MLALFQSLPERVGRPAFDPIAAIHYLDRQTTRTLARRYIESLSETAPPGAARIVDKMPDNINLLGWIALLWPRARVIVCHRDLRDIAVSCRQTDFISLEWTTEWEHLARRFADHLRIGDHWKRTRPLEWLDVRYEDLVADFEPNARRLIAYLDLDWEPACLEFHASRRIVRTASMVQVRQPIYSGSVQRWKNYESMLVPFYQALERLGVDLNRGG